MSKFDLTNLLDNLQPKKQNEFTFIGETPSKSMARIFGGQVVAQALSSAISTVEQDRHIHSLHGYFLRPGNPNKHIVYEVNPIRNGNSFSTREVSAIQNEKVIFTACCSFQQAEQGLEHQQDMPEVINPNDLECDWEYWQRLDRKYPGRSLRPPSHFEPIALRAVYRRDIETPKAGDAIQGYWVKTKQQLPDNLTIHQIMLSYFSDMYLLTTALKAHPVDLLTPNLQRASLDHSLWFHRNFRADQWLYFHMDSPSSAGSRGFNRGSFYTQDGCLVASCAQEGLMRLTS